MTKVAYGETLNNDKSQTKNCIKNALDIQNGVTQVLSSEIMTNNLRDAENFLSFAGVTVVLLL